MTYYTSRRAFLGVVTRFCGLAGWGDRIGLSRGNEREPSQRSLQSVDSRAVPANKGIWTSAEELAELSDSGPLWRNVESAADRPTKPPDLSEQDQKNSVHVLAKALVYARTGEQRYRDQVVLNCLQAIGTEAGRTLALARKLLAYVFAADLVGLPPDEDQEFREWLAAVRH